ncbi:glycosyltransferase family 2 protein [Balneolaceae bacterium YR4-1]|uniref:Glycosyltransferase family 2 protein n=1 Tax=Halalkalibaculum roseum TaxID=2709311 RepID=A0A6M1SZC1_9BACT|nr:glycosyltransferase family A protein [Halalkalibaculum roseum]NGP75927.1 glycosyltransferase family 2 protein [Halalkalibaculum roseum]
MNKLAIVTPVRDEEDVVEELILSVVQQDLLPNEWVFVDDNSVDSTTNIIKSYSQKFEFIKLVSFPKDTNRTPGTGVIRAFEYGLNHLMQEYDFLLKLDADLKFKPDYFQNIISEFEANEKLGIASGMIFEKNGKPVKKNISDHPYGATKFYRKSCFDQIKPLEKIKTWDLIDNIKANIAGYETKIIASEKVKHLKPMESAAGKTNENFLKGYYSSYLFYLFPFAMLKSIKVMTEKPYIVGGVVYLSGYLYNLVINRERYSNSEVVKYLRKQQKNRLKKLFKLT